MDLARGRGSWIGIAGYIVRKGATDRQKHLRTELPRLVDMLVVASSTGRGVQDAIVDVGPVLSGPLAKEWTRMSAQLTLGLAGPLRELAARSGLRELDVLVGHLIVAHERGQGLETNLVQLTETLREQRLQELRPRAGARQERCSCPVILLVYLPLLVVVLAPVAATLADLLSS